MASAARAAYNVRTVENTRSFVSAAIERPGVRVRTLVSLRWIAIAGQFGTLIVVGLDLDYPLAWPSLIAAVAAAAVLNVGLWTLYPRNARFNGRDALLQFAFDLVQAGVLLFLTGGLKNPFVVLLIVPVTISATLLSARGTLLLTAMASAIVFVLWRWALPLPWMGPPVILPPVYRFGVVVAIALAGTFLAGYTWLVSAEARKRAHALVATQSALERESRMSALGSLAAAAAHELGGPLGTITLIARELADSLGDDPDFGEDVRLLNREASRSRAILIGIARRAEAEDPFPRLSLDALLHEVAHPLEPARVPIHVAAAGGAAPMIRRTPELLHGVANLVTNAVRHAGSAVTLTATTTPTEVCISVVDDGGGFSDSMLPHLGEPFLGPSVSGSGGTGLGIFIATTLLERTGGRLKFSNRRSGGAQVDVRWLRSHIEVQELE
ncbi:ActS/PrrB/RegB family redox-sensitive histidine kinase [Polymorphobacter sp. PAMC 29334]|uniref:ActS/PrrB/RegB family redox-sensitive histidine kinase n=1 Tax=Polymorphobacter sp. PAMC 29334 TaxID=2862331 RepID=UPI001C75721C|nr:ActS/PrrB/RegB family redox-sensitive histidine kinase [Polymorphobacter sp. PAMC 29334]QYE35733.1 ActS/PrrB/RegB family redox-sensitive histidine kinase [Polymorphobacter sp. PAMC 29334]